VKVHVEREKKEEGQRSGVCVGGSGVEGEVKLPGPAI